MYLWNFIFDRRSAWAVARLLALGYSFGVLYAAHPAVATLMAYFAELVIETTLLPAPDIVDHPLYPFARKQRPYLLIMNGRSYLGCWKPKVQSLGVAAEKLQYQAGWVWTAGWALREWLFGAEGSFLTQTTYCFGTSQPQDQGFESPTYLKSLYFEKDRYDHPIERAILTGSASNGAWALAGFHLHHRVARLLYHRVSDGLEYDVMVLEAPACVSRLMTMSELQEVDYYTDLAVVFKSGQSNLPLPPHGILFLDVRFGGWNDEHVQLVSEAALGECKRAAAEQKVLPGNPQFGKLSFRFAARSVTQERLVIMQLILRNSIKTVVEALDWRDEHDKERESFHLWINDTGDETLSLLVGAACFLSGKVKRIVLFNNEEKGKSVYHVLSNEK